ncbi:MAG: TIGR04282 family arsenosugar biosynthesis glycosyltransferase [Brevirhabdus sp.]
MPKVLVIMVKLPRPGRVKTRLGGGIGMVAAAWWYRHQVARLLRRMADPRWQIVLSVAPDAEALAARVWPAHLPRVGQGPGDLGARMGRALAAFCPAHTVLIGSDIPGVTRAHIARAFATLGRADVVFGPAPDGGYWLVGMKAGRVPVGAFKGVRWSTHHALHDSLSSLGGARVAFADTLGDVDEAADLRSV